MKTTRRRTKKKQVNKVPKKKGTNSTLSRQSGLLGVPEPRQPSVGQSLQAVVVKRRFENHLTTATFSSVTGE